MNPSTLNILAGGEQFLGSFANAFADISQSNFIAQQFQMNEQIAEVQATQSEQQGQVEAELSQQRTGQLSGQQVASEAAEGVITNTGTSEATRLETSKIGSQDYLTIGNNAFLKGLGYKIQALNDTSSAQMELQTGRHQASNALLGGASEFYQGTMRAIAYDQQANQAGSGSGSSLGGSSANP